jgi:hypothetical protein
VTFLEAARKGKWIRRHGRTKVICISDTPTHLYSMTKRDFLAEDWELVGEEPAKEEDSSSVRFMMMELE